MMTGLKAKSPGTCRRWQVQILRISQVVIMIDYGRLNVIENTPLF